MITAKAKHWVNYNGIWHPKDDVFPIDDADSAMMRKYAILTEIEDKKKLRTQAPEPVKQGRRRDDLHQPTRKTTK